MSEVNIEEMPSEEIKLYLNYIQGELARVERKAIERLRDNLCYKIKYESGMMYSINDFETLIRKTAKDQIDSLCVKGNELIDRDISKCLSSGDGLETIREGI